MYIHCLNCVDHREIRACNFSMAPSSAHQFNRIGDQTHSLLYILDGTCEVWQANEHCTLEKGTVLFLHSNAHTFDRQSISPGAMLMFLHFSRHPEDRMFQNGEEGPQKSDRLIQLADIIHCENSGSIENQFKKIIYAFYSDRPNIQMKLSALLLDLLYELAQLTQEAATIPDADGLVEWVLHRIRTEPQRDCSVAAMAKEAFVSPSVLSERFKKATGMTIYRYQLDTRLSMARALLLSDASMPLREVARVYGFCDEYHFSKLFKKQYQVSPSVFRAQDKGNTKQEANAE